eukprot:6360669-Pyramimonas_sp.AAC.1
MSCACDCAISASSTTARTSCPADHICKWQLRANASPPIYGDTHATEQGDLQILLSIFWIGTDKEGAQKAEWWTEALAIMTAWLIDQMDLHKTHRSHTSAVHLSIHTRVDKGVRTYVQSPKNGPYWGHIVRRVTMNLDHSVTIQDTKVQDQPTGYNHNAPLQDGVTNIRAR